jgi:hypothetical protein
MSSPSSLPRRRFRAELPTGGTSVPPGSSSPVSVLPGSASPGEPGKPGPEPIPADRLCPYCSLRRKAKGKRLCKHCYNNPAGRAAFPALFESKFSKRGVSDKYGLPGEVLMKRAEMGLSLWSRADSVVPD